MRAKNDMLYSTDGDTETIPDEVEVIDVSKYQPKNVPSLTWRECIIKIWKNDPLICVLKILMLRDCVTVSGSARF